VSAPSAQRGSRKIAAVANGSDRVSAPSTLASSRSQNPDREIIEVSTRDDSPNRPLSENALFHRACDGLRNRCSSACPPAPPWPAQISFGSGGTQRTSARRSISPANRKEPRSAPPPLRDVRRDSVSGDSPWPFCSADFVLRLRAPRRRPHTPSGGASAFPNSRALAAPPARFGVQRDH
jgi:hypothetical protein